MTTHIEFWAELPIGHLDDKSQTPAGFIEDVRVNAEFDNHGELQEFTIIGMSDSKYENGKVHERLVSVHDCIAELWLEYIDQNYSKYEDEARECFNETMSELAQDRGDWIYHSRKEEGFYDG